MRVGVQSFAVLGAVVAVAGSACDTGGELTGSGGAGMIMTGRAGASMVSGRGGSGAGAGGTAGAAGSGGTFVDPCQPPFPTTIVPPDVLIVLDTSASMNDGFDAACAGGCGASSKWAAAVASIESVVNGSTVANWGLVLMSDGGNACGAGSVTVSAGPATGAQIQAALDSRSTPPALASPGNRPTRAAIKAAVTNRLAATDLGQAIIVLVTDGVPNCKAGEADTFASDADAAIQEVTYASNAGISTSIIGLGTAGGPADATLAQMAAAGSYPPSSGYTSISSAAELIDTLNSIAAQGGACRYPIPQPPTSDGSTSRSHIAVFIDQTQVPQDANDGWTYDGTQTILVLHGAACAASQGRSVSVEFLCLLP